MNVDKSIKLPEGHEEYDDKTIEDCPYMKIQKKAEQRKKDKVKPKREEEYYGGGGGCPFMMSGKAIPFILLTDVTV